MVCALKDLMTVNTKSLSGLLGMLYTEELTLNLNLIVPFGRKETNELLRV